ncbi:hypothetical protein [Actinophytocola sp.]
MSAGMSCRLHWTRRTLRGAMVAILLTHGYSAVRPIPYLSGVGP